jgi:cytochrome c553
MLDDLAASTAQRRFCARACAPLLHAASMHGALGTLVAASILVTGCPPATEPTPTPRASTQDGEQALGPVERVRRATTAHMGAHFADILEIHTSLVHGSLADAKVAARALADDRPDVMLEEWAPFLFALRRSADEVARARSLDDAAVHAAALARTCGDCHAAQGARLELVATQPPARSDDPAARMQRHAWAFNRLWEGIVLPSDESWTLGVNAFVELPECEDRMSSEVDRTAIERAREIVTASEAAARAATTRDERALVYGRMLPTCASCHASGC